jgi:hypothetical protein
LSLPLNRRTAALGLAIVLAVASAGRGLIWAVGEWQLSTELEQAATEMAFGRCEPARARLSKLSERWPGRDKIEYRLGLCEVTLGHSDIDLEVRMPIMTGRGFHPGRSRGGESSPDPALRCASSRLAERRARKRFSS